MPLELSLEALAQLNPASIAVFVGTVVLLLFISWLSRFLRNISPRHSDIVMAEPAPAEPVMCGEITLEELRAFDGSDASKPLYLACLGDVYDVTKGKDFYGPGNAYNKFAGREANRALAKMSLEEADCIPSIEGLSLQDMDILKDWKSKFDSKYAKVGKVVAKK